MISQGVIEGIKPTSPFGWSNLIAAPEYTFAEHIQVDNNLCFSDKELLVR